MCCVEKKNRKRIAEVVGSWVLAIVLLMTIATTNEGLAYEGAMSQNEAAEAVEAVTPEVEQEVETEELAESPEITAEPARASDEAAEPEVIEADEVVVDVSEGMDVASIQSFNFDKDTTVKKALQVLSVKYQKNIVPTSGVPVTGTLTFARLYDVTFEEALKAVIGVNKYEIEANFVKIYTPEEYEKMKADLIKMEHVVITLYYITAAEAKNLITPLLSESGSTAVTSPAELDTSVGSGGNTLAIRDRIVIYDYSEKIGYMKEVIASVDVMPPQILLEVTVIEAKLDESTKFGIDFDVLGVTTATDGTVILGEDAMSVGGLLGTVSGGMALGIVQDHVRVFIEALEAITDTTVLANTKIIALNKQAGKLLLGSEDGYLSSTTIGTAGGTSTSQIKMLKSGTILEFRPYICKDGYIRMEIYPEQSEGSVNETSGLPSKTTTTIQTNVIVKDGQSLVIGGLFKEKTVLTRNQVPLLGDIPFIGGLFRGTSDQSIRTELIVLMTPHIIKYPEMADGAKRLEDVQRIAHSARKNLTWMSRARRSEDQYRKAVSQYSQGDLAGALSTLDRMFGKERMYLDIERLREKIIAETQPDDFERLERILLDRIGQQESANWFRRYKR